jgi:hypothetical protein
MHSKGVSNREQHPLLNDFDQAAIKQNEEVGNEK